MVHFQVKSSRHVRQSLLTRIPNCILHLSHLAITSPLVFSTRLLLSLNDFSSLIITIIFLYNQGRCLLTVLLVCFKGRLQFSDLGIQSGRRVVDIRLLLESLNTTSIFPESIYLLLKLGALPLLGFTLYFPGVSLFGRITLGQVVASRPTTNKKFKYA